MRGSHRCRRAPRAIQSAAPICAFIIAFDVPPVTSEGEDGSRPSRLASSRGCHAGCSRGSSSLPSPPGAFSARTRSRIPSRGPIPARCTTTSRTRPRWWESWRPSGSSGSRSSSGACVVPTRGRSRSSRLSASFARSTSSDSPTPARYLCFSRARRFFSGSCCRYPSRSSASRWREAWPESSPACDASGGARWAAHGFRSPRRPPCDPVSFDSLAASAGRLRRFSCPEPAAARSSPGRHEERR